jgi:hypothetical protein
MDWTYGLYRCNRFDWLHRTYGFFRYCGYNWFDG